MMTNIDIRFEELKKYLLGERGIIIVIATIIGCCIYLYIVEFYTKEFSILKYIPSQADLIKFYSGTENSGIYYSIGEAFHETDTLIKNIPSSGGYENALKVLSDNKINSFGLVQEEAYLKDNTIRNYLNYVVPLYLERMHVFCRIDTLNQISNILTYNSTEVLYTLSKTKINVGPVGSGTNILSGYVIEELNKQIELNNSNLTKDDKNYINYISENLTYFDLDDAFKKETPIIFSIAGAPFKQTIHILNSGLYNLVSIDPLLVDKINQERNFGLRSVTFKGKYKDGEKINTFATTSFLITPKSTDPSIIKDFLDIFNEEKFKQAFYPDIGLILINDTLAFFPDNIVEILGLDSIARIKTNSNEIRYINIKNLSDTNPFKKEYLNKDAYFYALDSTINLTDKGILFKVDPHFEDFHFADIYSKQFKAESNLIIRNFILFFFSLIIISSGIFVLITNILSAIKYHNYFKKLTIIVENNVPDNALLNKESIIRMTHSEINEFHQFEKELLLSRLNMSLNIDGQEGKNNEKNDGILLILFRIVFRTIFRTIFKIFIWIINMVIRISNMVIKVNNKLRNKSYKQKEELIYENTSEIQYMVRFNSFINNIELLNPKVQKTEIINNNKINKLNQDISIILVICLLLLLLAFIAQMHFLLLISFTAIIVEVSLYFLFNHLKKSNVQKEFELYKDSLSDYAKKLNINQSYSIGQNIELPYLKRDQVKLINRINQGITQIIIIKRDIAEDYSDGGLKEKDYIFLMKNCDEIFVMLKKSLGARLLHISKNIGKEEMKKYLEIFKTAEYLDTEVCKDIMERCG